MKFLIVGDLHGQMPKIHFKEFDAIIAPGDFCSDEPKALIFQTMRERKKNLQSKLRWWNIVGKQKAAQMIEKSLADGRKILKYLNSFNVPVFIVPGNWDWTPEDPDTALLKKNLYPTLFKGLSNVRDIHHRIVTCKDHELIGHGIASAPEYPQYDDIKQRLSSEELNELRGAYEKKKEKVDALFQKAKKPVIFLSHNVPFNTPLDLITNKKSPFFGYHFGSLIVREMIEKHQPIASIGAHMHEHFGKCEIGDTVCINAGFGSEVNTLLELEGNNVRKLEFHPR